VTPLRGPPGTPFDTDAGTARYECALMNFTGSVVTYDTEHKLGQIYAVRFAKNFISQT